MMIFNAEIVCPKNDCGSDRIQVRTHTDQLGKNWTDIICADCGHKLSYDEIGRQLIAQQSQIAELPERD